MDEIWVVCDEFPEYSVSSLGRVSNTKRGKIVKQSITQQGAAKVNFFKDGRHHTRSVKVLVANAFVDGRTKTFDTPMHLDGNQANNEARNLVWRPRWFAWKYKRQLAHTKYFKNLTGPIKDIKTGLVYDSIVDAGLINGLLFNEIRRSLIDQTPVFPSWHVFGEVE